MSCPGIRRWAGSPEPTLRRAAHTMGYYYRLHANGHSGKPDQVFPNRHKVMIDRGSSGPSTAAPPEDRLVSGSFKTTASRTLDAVPCATHTATPVSSH
ncbi:MAG: hypothetical protein F4213_02180 [Boseongicola sp. SB0677_bin_26]|nr:hypothetical protein [Boseongicola sp. SB0665_bin_10]MYG24824.1 hypothetical protein [Boseongicola sp. SB0677_bin_26]